MDQQHQDRTPNDLNDELARNHRFIDAINASGQPFQYSLIKLVKEISSVHHSQWYFDTSEFPVVVNGHDTRIDIVLRRMGFCMVCECKRANPKYIDWCFWRTKHSGAHQAAFSYIVEVMSKRNDSLVSFGQELIGALPTDLNDFCHVGLGIKIPPKSTKANDLNGDKQQAQKDDSIELACGQVCKGTNGLINFLCRHERYISAFGVPKNNAYELAILPVIFTTANLWVYPDEIGEGVLETGTISADGKTPKNVDWLFYQYNVSPGIKHQLEIGKYPISKSLAAFGARESTRTIAIVNHKGIHQFLLAMGLDTTYWQQF